MAQEQMQKFRLGPLFTPPSLEGTLQRPGQGGGANWGGAAFDPESGYLFVRATRGVGVNRVAKNDGSDPLVEVPYSKRFARGGRRPKSTVCRSRHHLTRCLRRSILNRGEIAWKVPLGEGDAAIRNHPLLEGRHAARSPRVAKQSRRRDGHGKRPRVHRRRRRYFYAFDTKTGKEVWRAEDPVHRTRRTR